GGRRPADAERRRGAPSAGTRRERASDGGQRGPSSGLAEDPVHLGAADRAGALRHPAAGLTDLDLAVEVPLLLALDAVAVVGVRHGLSSVVWGAPAGTPARRCGARYPDG